MTVLKLRRWMAAAGLRHHLITAAGVTLAGQVLFTWGASLVPDEYGNYGAPFPVGDSTGIDFVFGSAPSFFLGLWLVNFVITAAVVLVLAMLLDGRIASGALAVSGAVVITDGIVLGLRISEARVNQLLIWGVMLLVLASVWGLGRLGVPPFRRPQTAPADTRAP